MIMIIYVIKHQNNKGSILFFEVGYILSVIECMKNGDIFALGGEKKRERE